MEYCEKKQIISPEKALANAKSAFKKHGPIQGSWIQMERKPYKKSLLQYEVYIGGISRTSVIKQNSMNLLLTLQPALFLMHIYCNEKIPYEGFFLFYVRTKPNNERTYPARISSFYSS